MKNIAIPLLAAGANAARPAGMAADEAWNPDGWLGAGAPAHADGCEDDAPASLVKAAKTALKSAEDALKTAVDKLAKTDAPKGEVQLVKEAKTASDQAFVAAQAEAVKQKALIDSAFAKAEAERAAEGAEADAIAAKAANAALVLKLAAEAKTKYGAYKLLKADQDTFQASVTKAKAHLAKERAELAVALCRLQPAGNSDPAFTAASW
jgi:hypothetical protein